MSNKNPNIGTVICGFRGCDQVAAVRKNASGRLYTDCIKHGVMQGVLAVNQDQLLAEADIWGQDGAPAGTPRWIAEQWPTKQARALPDVALEPSGVRRSAVSGQSRENQGETADPPDLPPPPESSDIPETADRAIPEPSGPEIPDDPGPDDPAFDDDLDDFWGD